MVATSLVYAELWFLLAICFADSVEIEGLNIDHYCSTKLGEGSCRGLKVAHISCERPLDCHVLRLQC
jgi:hypothetical protein